MPLNGSNVTEHDIECRIRAFFHIQLTKIHLIIITRHNVWVSMSFEKRLTIALNGIRYYHGIANFTATFRLTFDVRHRAMQIH